MLLATAAASTVLVLGAPGAYAAGDEWDQTDSSHSKESEKEYSKESEKESEKEYSKESEEGSEKEYSKESEEGSEKEYSKDSNHESPWGGMHTGGGALTMVNEDDWGTAKDPKYDPETYKEKDSEDSGSAKKDEHSWSGKHEKPSGGMHTGGGGLASPAVNAGGLAVLALAGTGLYVARRKKSAGSVA
ncbi:hypothetical protein [Streptomyces cupreus]|uniref:LPXTG cell wall anchor domain-containing protein n=1 Tax=Streptomyces cupreus TaxID=2759956 RepID=A0A7X1J6Y6_9ACTN|nr:hypothetical protein [Streptomyces cupreus]MBC2905338.1 hypothetical protein [Streptomyces cupreus]